MENQREMLSEIKWDPSAKKKLKSKIKWDPKSGVSDLL